MTLQQFLKATATVPVPRLRQAMAAALTVEPARTTAEYRRFYRRVTDALGAAADLRTPAEATRRATPSDAVAPSARGTARARRLSTARACAVLP